jgi:hypothetical protein
MLYWSFLSYKKKLFNLVELLAWVVIWLTFLTVIVFPESVKIILETFKINRTMDLLMILAFMLLWLITYKNYTDNKQLRNKLQDLVKAEAISGAVKMSKSKSKERK